MSQSITVQTISLVDYLTNEITVTAKGGIGEQWAVDVAFRYAQEGMAYRFLGKRGVITPSTDSKVAVKITHAENLTYWTAK